MKVKDYVARFLAEQGVPCVFELPGGMSAHFIDSLCQQGRVRIVSVHHEQSAAFAADATGRLTGVPGVAVATSGRGGLWCWSGAASARRGRPTYCGLSWRRSRFLSSTRSWRLMSFRTTIRYEWG